MMRPETIKADTARGGAKPVRPVVAPGRLPDLPPGEAGRRNPLLLDISTFVMRFAEFMAIVTSAILVTGLIGGLGSQADYDRYTNAAALAAFFYAGLAEVIGAYDIDVRFSVQRAWGRVLTAWLSTGMFMLTMGFLLKVSDDFSRGWGISWFVSGAVALCLIRAGGTAWMRSMKRQGVFNQRVAIFGAGSQGDRLAGYIAGNEKLTIDLVGFYDDRMPERLPDREIDLAMRGNMKDLVQRIREGEVDQVIIALPWSAETRLQEVVAALAITPVRIRLAPDLASFAFAQRPVVLLGDLPVMTLFERPISGFDQVIKKFEDMTLGVLALVLVSPVLLIAAIAIKLDSRGPVFFRQDREGFNNQRFRIWKFRSMRTDHCEIEGITQATRRDPRITRVGAFLRRTSIDELPQLFNVLSGEMSLVGPRPHAPSTRAGERLFSEVVATYAARHKVKPGMTGWAQVFGWRGETDTEDKLVKRLEHDLYYIENWSVSLDLYIMLRTVLTQFFSKKAY